MIDHIKKLVPAGYIIGGIAFLGSIFVGASQIPQYARYHNENYRKLPSERIVLQKYNGLFRGHTVYTLGTKDDSWFKKGYLDISRYSSKHRSATDTNGDGKVDRFALETGGPQGTIRLERKDCPTYPTYCAEAQRYFDEQKKRFQPTLEGFLRREAAGKK